MRVIIAGSRSLSDYTIVDSAVKNSGFDVSEVISGGARGVDRVGEEWARRNGIPFIRFPAKWDKHGKAAGYLRNQEMADVADALVAVWDGVSLGTKHMIDIATSVGLDVFIRRESPEDRTSGGA